MTKPQPLKSRRHVLDFRMYDPQAMHGVPTSLSEETRTRAARALQRLAPMQLPHLVLVSHSVDTELVLHLPWNGRHCEYHGVSLTSIHGLSSALRVKRTNAMENGVIHVVSTEVMFPINRGGWPVSACHLADAIVTLGTRAQCLKHRSAGANEWLEKVHHSECVTP